MTTTLVEKNLTTREKSPVYCSAFPAAFLNLLNPEAEGLALQQIKPMIRRVQNRR